MKRPTSSRFDLSHDVKLSFSMGQLIPTLCMEVLPGDSIQVSCENMLRLAPLISPVMHKINVETHYFFVPNRLLWSEWSEWITGNSEVEAPVCSLELNEEGSIGDHLGLPIGGIPDEVLVSPFQFAAYTLIWDEYYRDQNLQTKRFVPLIPGDNTFYSNIYNTPPYKRAWKHDYFTSALPFAQKGAEVQIPLTFQNNIPVEFEANGNPGGLRNTDGTFNNQFGAIINNSGPVPFSSSMQDSDDNPIAYDPRGTLNVDVQSDAASISDLRRAFSLQAWLEKNARGGTRYVENLLVHWGVKSSDARQQRPEFIGSVKQNMIISEVLATAQDTTEGVALGQQGGHGISVGGGKRFTYRSEEHGFLIGIINVQPDTAYQQGVHRQFSRFDRLDYAWPIFAHIGEQEILNKELYVGAAAPNGTFGYIPRYSEYRYLASRVAGAFRTTLSFWHMGRIFSSPPGLNESFIQADPTKRIFAVTDENEDSIYSHIFHNIMVNRKLPRHGIPSTI